MNNDKSLRGCPSNDQLDKRMAAISAAYDKRLCEIVASTSDLPNTYATEIVGKVCSEMMRESLPPVDTPTTTKDGQPRAITISSMVFG